MSSAVVASASVHSGVAGRAGQHQVAEALGAGAERDEQQRRRRRCSRKSRISSPCSSVSVSPNGRSRRDDRDLLGRPGTRGPRPRRSRPARRAAATSAAVGGVDRAGAVAVLVEGLDPHAGARKPSTRASLAVGEDPLEAELGGGRADDPAGGLGHPDLLGERLALERDDHGAAGLLGVPVEHARAAPRRGGGRRRAGRWRGCRAARRRRRTAARSAGPAGARRPGASIGSMSGTQPQVSPALGVEPLVRDEPEQAPVVGLLELRQRAGRSGCGCPASCVAGLVAAGDGHRPRACRPSRTTLIAAIPKPASSGDALGDQLEGVTRRRVGPARCGLVGSWSWRVSRDISSSCPLRGRDSCYVGRSPSWHRRVRATRDGESADADGRALDSARALPDQPPQGWRRPADRGPRPPRPGSPGRLRRLRRLGPGRGRRQADLLRPLRAAAPRPGVGRHRGQQRPPDPGLQGHGPGLPGLRRDHARLAQGPPRDRPLPLLDDRRQHLAERPADVPPHRRRLDRAGPQRQPDQHRRAARSWSSTCPAPTTSSTCTPATSETSTNDTGLVTALLAHHPDTSLEQRALEVLPLLQGAFCFVWMNEDTLYAARDPQGIRPLVLGRLDRGWVVASARTPPWPPSAPAWSARSSPAR